MGDALEFRYRRYFWSGYRYCKVSLTSLLDLYGLSNCLILPCTSMSTAPWPSEQTSSSCRLLSVTSGSYLILRLVWSSLSTRWRQCASINCISCVKFVVSLDKMSWFDYGNVCLAGLLKSTITLFQRVQSTLLAFWWTLDHAITSLPFLDIFASCCSHSAYSSNCTPWHKLTSLKNHCQRASINTSLKNWLTWCHIALGEHAFSFAWNKLLPAPFDTTDQKDQKQCRKFLKAHLFIDLPATL